jgi:hypothetical protein
VLNFFAHSQCSVFTFPSDRLSFIECDTAEWRGVSLALAWKKMRRKGEHKSEAYAEGDIFREAHLLNCACVFLPECIFPIHPNKEQKGESLS